MTLYQEGMCDVSGQAEQVELTMADPCENLQLKIMFMVTPAAEAEEPDPEGKARLTIAQLNDIWTSSGPYRFAKFAGIVYMSDISSMNSEQESGNTQDDVDRWSDNALFPAVSYYRNPNDADIVVFLAGDKYGIYNGRSKTVGVAPNADYGFCVVTIKTTADCRYVGSHEITHVLGGRHDDDITDYRGYDFRAGGFLGLKRRFTIMSTEKKIKPRITHISNPDVDFRNKATGTSQNRVADIVEQSFEHVARFKTDPPFSFYADMNIGGSPKCNLQRSATISAYCGYAPYSYSWEKSYNGVNWYSLTSANTSSVNFQMALPVPGNAPNASMMIRCTVTDAANNTVVVTWPLHYFCDPVQKSSITDQEDKIEPLSVYPNPSKGNFTVAFIAKEETASGKIRLIDLAGSIVFTQSFGHIRKGENSLNLELSDRRLSAGSYVIEVEIGSEKIKTNIQIF